MAKLIDISAAAKMMGVADRTLRDRCAAGRISGAIKRDGGWSIPASYDTRLEGVTQPKDIGLDTLTDVPVNKRDEAIRRMGQIKEADLFIGAAVREGQNRCDALERFARSKQINSRGLRRWMKSFRRSGLPGLIDKRGGQCQGDLISPEAWDYFQRQYLDLRRPSVTNCWEDLRLYAKENKLDWRIPALRTVHAMVDKRIPLPVRVLHREGHDAYTSQCEPYIVFDPDSVEPGQIWVGDHHELDLWIRHRGEWRRPWISAWQDMRSRKIVGHCISVAPNSVTIMRAFKMACEKYGPPDAVKIDNGKDYSSQMFTGKTKAQRRALGKHYLDEDLFRGMYGMLGVTVSFAIPYRAKAKRIERWFKTVADQFSKAFPTYCGRNTMNRPDGHAEYLETQEAKDNAYTLESFTEVFGRYIDAFGAAPHSGVGMDGQSPDAVFARRTSHRVLLDGVLDLLCRAWSRKMKIGKNGINFQGIFYGQTDPVLRANQGRAVRISFDPDDVTSVRVYDAKTMKLLTVAQQEQMIRYADKASDEDVRAASREIARNNRLVRDYRNLGLGRIMDKTNRVILIAQERALDNGKAADTPRVIKPVGTVLDGQVKAHKEVVNQNTAKAAKLPEFDIDYDLMRRPEKKLPEFEVDWEAMYERNHPREPETTNDLGMDWRELKQPRTGGANMDYVLDLNQDKPVRKQKKQQAG